MRLDWARTASYRLRLVSAAGQAMGVGRTKGDHLSDTIRFIGIQMGEQWEEGFDEERMSPATKARLMGGFVLELCLQNAFREWLQKSLGGAQLEIEAPGPGGEGLIKMTPDWLDEEGTVWEAKSTIKTRRRFDEALALVEQEMEEGALFEETSLFLAFWNWFLQAMAYAKHLGSTQVNLVVWWKRGNYSKDWSDEDGKEDVRVYPFTFEQAELERAWDKILQYEAARRAA